MGGRMKGLARAARALGASRAQFVGLPLRTDCALSGMELGMRYEVYRRGRGLELRPTTRGSTPPIDVVAPRRGLRWTVRKAQERAVPDFVVNAHARDCSRPASE